MKSNFVKYFAVFGLTIYYILAMLVRIPVFVLLAVLTVFFTLIYGPLKGDEGTPKWVQIIYDWYCGR